MDAHLVLDRTEETRLLLRRLTTLVENCKNLVPPVSICAAKGRIEVPSSRGSTSWAWRTKDRA